MNPFIVVRGVAWVGFLMFMFGTVLWMWNEKVFYRAIPLLGGAIHGTIYYGLYLLFYIHPALPFSLQFFADWGAVFLLQIAWTGVLITWDMATGWFSEVILPFALDRMGRRKVA